MQFFQKIKVEKTCARVEFGPSKIEGNSNGYRTSSFPNAQNMHKIIVLSSMCKICTPLYS